MYTSSPSFIKSEEMLRIALLNVARALHRPKGKTL